MADAAHIKPLTSLRFFAALWVVVFHYWPNLAAAGGMPALVAKGYLGVELFFVLSGFILCHVYLPSYEAGRFRYGDFIWARLARIYPMHLATLVAIGLMAVAATAAGWRIDPNLTSVAALPANLLLAQAWGLAPVAGWNHPSWSISAEWFAYLLFPMFAAAALGLGRRPRLAVLGAVGLLWALYAGFPTVAGFPLTQATIAGGALRIIPCFALGCALFLLWREPVAMGRTAVFGACFFGTVSLLGAQLGAPDAVIVTAFGGLIISLAQVSRSGSRIGTSRILTYLGEISYSIYMICIPWQLLCVNASVKFLHLPSKQLPLGLWIIYVAALIPLAAASHHLIERPAREGLKLWWISRPTHKLATVTTR